METLAACIARHGALGALDAVGWVVRLAKRIEAHHRSRGLHGAISVECVLVERPRRTSRGCLVDAKLCPKLGAYHSPERGATGPPSTTDDAWAVAVTLYTLLSGAPPRVEDGSEVQPLTTFGIEDAELQAVLDAALRRDAKQRITDVATLRTRLERWRADARLDRLPAIEAPAGAELVGEPSDDEKTAIRLDGQHLRAHIDAILAETRGEPASPPPAPPPRALPVIERATQAPAEEDVVLPRDDPPDEGIAPVAPRVREPAIHEGSPPWRRRAAWALAAVAIVTASAVLVPRLRARAQPLAVAQPTLAAARSAPPPPAAASSQPAPPSAASAPRSTDATACVREVLPPDSFEKDSGLDFGFMCRETDPRRGAAGLKKRIVLGGANRRVTTAMREWSMLGWYEMPAYMVTRAACCPGAPDVELPVIASGSCEPFVDVLKALARSVGDPAAGVTEDALQRYTRTVYCAIRTGSGNAFGPPRLPTGGEETAFKKTLERIRARAEH